MNDQQLLSTIVASAFTKSDIQRRLRILRGYLEHTFYSTDGHLNLPEYLDSKQISPDDHEAMVAYGDAFYQSFSKDTMYRLLDKLADDMKVLPIINVYIPYEPIPGEVMRLGKWFRKNVDPTMVVELHIDPTLLGGCAFAWQGIYRDYSLRHYMYKRREEISQIIERYARELKES